MLSLLKDHPFAVEAFFENSFVLTFAVPKEQIKSLIPECLTLDLFENKWGFIAIAMVQTRELRPKGFPRFLGNNFFLIGYRIFVKYLSASGKRLRGLYIIKSETDQKKMELLGNVFTHYNYTTTDIEQVVEKNKIEIRSKKSSFDVTMERSDKEISLPENSPFSSWKEARRFAGPLPFTFTYNINTKQVLIIEGVRQNWIPNPIMVTQYNFSFIDSLKFNGAVLANAFVISDIPYYWKKGKKEQWKN
jgi:hypothetical protein